MEAIEAVDWGAYAHFRHQVGQHPGLMPIMAVAYYLSDYLAIGFLFSLAAVLFVAQGKYRSSQVTALSLAASLALIFGTRFLIPRTPPPDAQNFLPPSEMQGSYPSANVFLFMLAMILIGLALWGLVRQWWQRALYTVIAVALTAWVCMSQIYLAVHFLTDVLGGIAGATLVGWIAYQFIDRDAGHEYER